jgi:hypothetical protein
MSLTSNEWIAAIKEQMIDLNMRLTSGQLAGVAPTEETVGLVQDIAKNCDTALEVLVAEQEAP